MEQHLEKTPRRVSDPELDRAVSLARWLDGRLLDPLLGLFLPGVGDIAASGIGLYLVVLAVKRRLPAVVVARMLLNLATDAIVGGVPLLGDLFDFAFRANMKNAELLTTRAARGRYTAGDLAVVLGAALLLAAAVALPIFGLAALWNALR
jgi:hypothetical protein